MKEAEPVKPKTVKPTPPPPPPYEADYDSDIESDIKALEERENNNQDRNTDDIKKWKKKINSIWNDEITEIFENIDDTDDTYEATLSHDDYNKKAKAKLLKKFDSEAVSIVKTYINRTKAQTRGSKKEIGEWAGRNPQSLKKVITSIVNTIKKGVIKNLNKPYLKLKKTEKFLTLN